MKAKLNTTVMMSNEHSAKVVRAIAFAVLEDYLKGVDVEEFRKRFGTRGVECLTDWTGPTYQIGEELRLIGEDFMLVVVVVSRLPGCEVARYDDCLEIYSTKCLSGLGVDGDGAEFALSLYDGHPPHVACTAEIAGKIVSGPAVVIKR